MDEISKIFRHVDVGRLLNRLEGSDFIEFEHCLIEILGELSEINRTSRNCFREMAQRCLEANSAGEFTSAYEEYAHEKRKQFEDLSICSPVGEYFEKLLVRLNQEEERQMSGGSTAPVAHARLLCALIVRQMEVLTFNATARDEQVETRMINLNHGWAAVAP